MNETRRLRLMVARFGRLHRAAGMKRKPASPRPAVPGRLFRKYLLIMIGLLGAALLASGLVQSYLSYDANRRALLDVQGEESSAGASAVKTHLEGITGQVAEDLAVMSTGYVCPGITADACLQARPEDVWQKTYVGLLDEVPDITEIWQLDRSGQQLLHLSRAVTGFVVNPGTELITRQWSHTSEFTQPAGVTPYYGPVSFPAPGSPGSMRVSFSNWLAVATSYGAAPVPSVYGATVIAVRLDFARQAIQLPLPPGEDAFLIDSRGRVLAATDPQVLTSESLAARGLVRAALLSSSAAAQAGSATGIGPRNTEMLASYTRVAPTGWLLFVEQPQAQAFAPLYGLITRLGLLLLVALLLSATASFVLARRMVQPIDALRRGAARVGGGDMSEPIGIRTGDELQALAEEFNRMTARLRESYEGLEQKVEERTRELAAAVYEIQDKSRQLEAASRHKSEFLASMSHELRTPLNAIIGFSEALIARMYGDLNPKQAEYLEDVHSSGQHLLSLINDILDLSKVEAGRMEVHRSVFSLPEVLGNSLSMIRERASGHGIVLETAIDPALGLVEADERKVKQILFNLLSNAVKFTPTGGCVTISARQLGDAVEVSVSDTGIGIAQVDQERIFEEFEQLGGPAQEGTGLGLALTRKFVELQGGRIRVDSVPGQGSTFTFTLPLTAVAVGEVAEVAS